MKRLRTFHRTKTGLIFLSFLGLILTLSLILFTPWGNRLITPIVEKSLSFGLSTPMNIQEFSLSHNQFHLIAQDPFGNTLSTQGGFSLLTLRMYAHYRIECLAEGGFNPLKSSLKTEGSLSGGIASFNIRGNATLFGGDILYKIELHRFTLSTLNLTLDQIEYESMMHYLEYPSDTDTLLSGSVDLHGFDRRDVMGKIYLSTQTKRFTPTPIMEDSNSSFDLKSLLTDKFGQIKPFTIDVALDATLTHAGVLEQLIGISLGGELNAHGTLKGDEALLKFKIFSDVAQGETKLTVLISDLEPSRISIDLSHADAKKTFELFALPSPINGKLSAFADLNTTEGKLQISITEGSTIPTVLKKHYQITQPFVDFSAEVNAHLSSKGVDYRAMFTSDLAQLEIDNTTTHDQMLRDLLKAIPSGSPHR
jgi:hypothetical protein